jgi:hypothetical protein
MMVTADLLSVLTRESIDDSLDPSLLMFVCCLLSFLLCSLCSLSFVFLLSSLLFLRSPNPPNPLLPTTPQNSRCVLVVVVYTHLSFSPPLWGWGLVLSLSLFPLPLFSFLLFSFFLLALLLWFLVCWGCMVWCEICCVLCVFVLLCS